MPADLTLTRDPDGSGEASLTEGERRADYEQMCNFVSSYYCYFAEKATDWEAVVSHYRPLVKEARSRKAFIRVLESVLDQLYDAHTHLILNLPDSWRPPGYDIWAESRDGRAVVLEVRSDSPAERAGVRPGFEIATVDGEPVATAAAKRRPHFLQCSDPEADQWALLSAISGKHEGTRELLLCEPHGAPHRLRLLEEPSSSTPEPPVTSRSVDPGIGYIRIASFQADTTVREFDLALMAQRETRGLLIDVRNNPGGDTLVTRPIMGRFLKKRSQYAWMRRRRGRSWSKWWPEHVEPTGAWTYMGDIVVLVNHWTMSVAEDFAMGLDAVGRAAIVGTRMAGLGAAILRATLEHSGISLQVSAEPVYHVNGQPRLGFRPTLQVDLTLPHSLSEADAVYAAGLAVLHHTLEGSSRGPSGKDFVWNL